MAEQKKGSSKKLNRKQHKAACNAHPVTGAFLATWETLAGMSNNSRETLNTLMKGFHI